MLRDDETIKGTSEVSVPVLEHLRTCYKLYAQLSRSHLTYTSWSTSLMANKLLARTSLRNNRVETDNWIRVPCRGNIRRKYIVLNLGIRAI